MSEISKVIASEIADFFAGFGGPGEPDIQIGEAQRLLTERLLSVLALRERAEPVAWTDEQELRDVNKHGCGYLFTVNPITPNADPRRVIKLYAEPPAPVVPDDDQARQAYENHVRSRYQYPMLERHPEDGRPWHGEYKESARQMEWEDWLHSWNACRAAMLATPGKEG
ncbi:hypothetical protein ROM22_18475 [Cronobacter sakazakii]|uniref:hypothetical protein n=1 Tax=Cronobacter sakazakii TaxID=28141 RepID=UPI0028958937|nr:hypothetical protein [Cronobacter sakazakii]MDT3550206.1 hypothetical protein [Cronobacter sakazakii]MDT3635921.1 hypothetical protein [Cronobacter sakazakii]